MLYADRAISHCGKQFDASIAGTLRSLDRFLEPGMTLLDADSPELANRPAQLPKLPLLWIGYLLGVVTIVAEFVALSLHPELAKEGGIPPLYLFLASFVGIVYWLVCVHQVHVVLKNVRGWSHPISPARAVGFHLIPVYNLYWIFKWPREIATFVNARLGRPVMKPLPVGIAILGALILRILDPGFGLILLFFPMSYVSECLRRAFAAPTGESGGLPPVAAGS
jgi:hypothetical protein